MPKWSCSALQRFAQCIDLQSINWKQYPELGPLYWTKKTYSGIKRKPKQTAELNSPITTRSTKMQLVMDLDVDYDKMGMPVRMRDAKRPYVPAYWFPVFQSNGQRFNAIRWLFFQMYNDTGLRDPDIAWSPVQPWDAPSVRKQLKQMWGADSWIESGNETPPRYRPYSLVTNQRELIVCLFMLSPYSGTYRADNEFYYLYDGEGTRELAPGKRYTSLQTEHMSPLLPLTIVKWTDWRTRVSTTSKKVRVSKQSNAPKFPRIPLEFPEVVGRQRLELVRHYLRGGTDDDRPFAGKYIEEEF